MQTYKVEELVDVFLQDYNSVVIQLGESQELSDPGEKSEQMFSSVDIAHRHT